MGFGMVKLSEERQLRITALFRAFDYDSSGAIEPQEFLCIGKALKNGEWTEEMNAKAHARVDTDKGGSIDVLEFCSFFENNMPKNRTDEQFFKLMDRYMAAAIAGRVEYYFNQGAALRSTNMSADAPESFKIKAEADARAVAHEQSAQFIAKQAIEAQLGEFGINCFEDLIHEIYTVGPHFKQANNFLWPFKLNSAKGGLARKRLGFNEGGQA